MFIGLHKKKHNSNFNVRNRTYKAVNNKKQNNNSENEKFLNINNRNFFFHKNDVYRSMYKKQNEQNLRKQAKYCGKKAILADQGKNKEYIGASEKITRDNDISIFSKKYKIEECYKKYKLDNTDLEDNQYKSYTISVKKHDTLTEEEVKKMIDFDKNGNLVLKKKNMNNTDLRKVVKYIFSEMHYAIYLDDPDIVIPIEPLFFKTCENGGSFGINSNLHPSYAIDSSGQKVKPNSFKEKLTRLMISKMRYPHPYPYTDTVHRANKIYEYKTDIRVLDHTFLQRSVKTTNAKELEDCVKKIAKYIHNAEKLKKNVVVSMPIAIHQEGHAVLLNCSFDRRQNILKVNVINTNGWNKGFNAYGKPIFLAIESLLPMYIKKSCRMVSVYSELGNQVGPMCMEYAEREGYKTLRRDKNGTTTYIEAMHNALLRAGECELSKELGLKSDIQEPEVKKIESLQTNNLKDYHNALLKKKIQKDYQNNQSRDNILHQNNYNKDMYKNGEDKTANSNNVGKI